MAINYGDGLSCSNGTGYGYGYGAGCGFPDGYSGNYGDDDAALP